MENKKQLIPENASGQRPWFSLLTDFDINLFKAGKHYQLYEKLGSHRIQQDGIEGFYFAVWAPNARYVSLIGNFNGWDSNAEPMRVRWDGSGIWEIFIPGLSSMEYYKYFIESNNGYQVEKGDPFAFHWETPPLTASVTWDLSFEWTDKEWLKTRANTTPLDRPLSIYEVHLGSWRRTEEGGESRFMTYREIAATLPGYCSQLGFTHVELMPVMEHPFYGSWGYQITGYFAPSARFGTPQDLMYLIDQFHAAGIAVILDWVPSHFPTDEHGLGYFDGTHLYEYPDPRKGFHPDWKSNIFNFDRNEVRALLISNARYWLDHYHIDALRVDGVASILYLDYSRKAGEWIPNIYGGRENLEAVSFLQEFNDAVHAFEPGLLTIAEESTAWPGVTHPTSEGGLGFDLKWMMGWMHDTLDFFSLDPIYRKYHLGQLSFSLVYAFTEKFILPLSHDEVVYGKHSLIEKMPGDHWQQFANLRLLYSTMYGHPGAKLIFMGGEFAQQHEWQHDYSLDWQKNGADNQGIVALLTDLNALNNSEAALYNNNYQPEGFEWISLDDAKNSVICWIRKSGKESLVFIANYTPVVLENYRIGVPMMGYYEEVFNSDDLKYGGSDVLNRGEIETAPIAMHGRTHSLPLTLPPLAVVVLKFARPYQFFLGSY